MKQMIFLIASCALLSACTRNVVTTLRNESTGETATCKGQDTDLGTISGIGVVIEKNNDSECIQSYLNRGFTRQYTTKSIF